MQQYFDLSNKVALVTGASRGIGKEIAMLLARHGAHVVVSSRKVDDCLHVVGELEREGFSASAKACHIGDMDGIYALFDHVKETFGRLDCLINNAATNPYFGPIIDTDIASFQKVMDVNLRGYFYMCVEGAKLMRENGGGSIVNTASVNAITPAHLQGIYSISKAAVVHMTKAFAKECAADGVRVNALLPGLTKTKFAGALFDDEAIYQNAITQIPMGRECVASEQAGAVLYLVSDMASYTTGASIVVDGGLTA